MKKKILLISLGIIVIYLLYLGARELWYMSKYKLPVVSPDTKFDHQIVFLGDSMTEYLGNFEDLHRYLGESFPNKKFLLLNYGYSATNLLSALERIEKDTPHLGRAFQPINNIPYDLIFIESFGHNPLSEYSLGEGLKKQNEELDKIINSLTKVQPREKIIFIATIAPNKKMYAKNLVELSDSQREKWADERSSYIKNHIKYAQSHGFKILNIYEKSLNSKGDGELTLISPKDYIHPSKTGVSFISYEIANFLKENNDLLK